MADRVADRPVPDRPRPIAREVDAPPQRREFPGPPRLEKLGVETGPTPIPPDHEPAPPFVVIQHDWRPAVPVPGALQTPPFGVEPQITAVPTGRIPAPPLPTNPPRQGPRHDPTAE